jgi:hypothetical protein
VTGDTKQPIVGLLGAAGAVVLLFGLPAETSEFMLGLVNVIAVWLVCGLLARCWEVPRWSLDDRSSAA